MLAISVASAHCEPGLRFGFADRFGRLLPIFISE
jgi:hypothetical protein